MADGGITIRELRCWRRSRTAYGDYYGNAVAKVGDGDVLENIMENMGTDGSGSQRRESVVAFSMPPDAAYRIFRH